ncbi:MAG: Gfo/Idh/MocA family oxidoreductase [Chlorobi bacterium]|nr:Gfo/Idh/MocA family oxidoreductase [Chlorobiota bacterium]
MENLEKFKVAIIGAGRWGFNHVRTANSILDPKNITVFDSRPEIEEKISELNSEINFTTNFNDVLDDKSIKAVIIATPAETHFEIAKKCMESGKNALVEKPITLLSKEAEDLHKLSIKLNLKLMVGHVLLYHPAILRIKEGLKQGEIGILQYIYSNRLNLGAIRSEENILWSFAPHDISVIQFFIDENPISIKACGSDILQDGIEDTTITYLDYPGKVSAHIFVSWLHPFKEQRLIVTGDKGMYVFEDSAKTEKLKLYEKGFKKVNGNYEKFDNQYKVIEFENKMPLTEEQLHFYESIINDTQPRTDGKHAFEVLQVLNKATESLRS